jgi:spore germination protein YaaH
MFGVSPGNYIDQYKWSELGAVSDYAFYMCYDWNSPALGPMTNPSGGTFTIWSGLVLPEFSCRAAINYMIAQGYPAEKIVVGFGFYSTWGNHYSTASASVKSATPHASYMEVYVDSQYWLNAAGIRLKIDAVMSPTSSVLTSKKTVGGIGWWEWGYENPATPDLSAAAKAKMATY